MYTDSEEVRAERARRRREGIPTFSWYKCHGCGAEYRLTDGVRASWGCDNPACTNSDVHIHSDIDGEKPTTL